MKELSSYILSNDRSRLSAKTLVSCFLIIVLGFTFWSGRFMSLIQPVQNHSTHLTITTSDSSDEYVKFSSLAFVSKSLPEQLETQDDVTIDDDDTDTDIYLDRVHHEPFTQRSPDTGSNKLIAHLFRSLHNRVTPGLFVLHHSWKSFLS